MAQDDIESVIMRTLYGIAPELEGRSIDPKVNFRDQFDFDSVDFVNFVISLEKAAGVRVPEMDYPKLSSLAGCLDYLRSRAETA